MRASDWERSDGHFLPVCSSDWWTSREIDSVFAPSAILLVAPTVVSCAASREPRDVVAAQEITPTVEEWNCLAPPRVQVGCVRECSEGPCSTSEWRISRSSRSRQTPFPSATPGANCTTRPLYFLGRRSVSPEENRTPCVSEPWWGLPIWATVSGTPRKYAFLPCGQLDFESAVTAQMAVFIARQTSCDVGKKLDTKPRDLLIC